VHEKIKPEWLEFINNSKLEEILNKVQIDKKINKIYPYPCKVLESLCYFNPRDTKLIIIGQDPYINYETHNNEIIPQACGLSFSVPKKHKKIPPSLQNIIKELKNSIDDYEIPKHGSLIKWVKYEKILLLNSALTVIHGKSNSQQAYWESFTNDLIKWISDTNQNIIYLLMGRSAQNKEKFINSYNNHKIFKVVHPSPLSAYKGFFGCDVFKDINEYLIEKNKEPIRWSSDKQINIE
jgi:uracil-DNA glycosylase